MAERPHYIGSSSQTTMLFRRKAINNFYKTDTFGCKS